MITQTSEYCLLGYPQVFFIFAHRITVIFLANTETIKPRRVKYLNFFPEISCDDKPPVHLGMMFWLEALRVSTGGSSLLVLLDTMAPGGSIG